MLLVSKHTNIMTYYVSKRKSNLKLYVCYLSTSDMQDDSDRVRLLCHQLSVRVQGHYIPCGRGNPDIQRFTPE